MSDDRASAALPPNHPLYAPGLKRRPRAGWELRVWFPTPKDIKAGFHLKRHAMPQALSEIEVAAHCRRLWVELLHWRAGFRTNKELEHRHTFSWLIDRYKTDEHSGYHGIQSDTRANYDRDCEIIRQNLGEVRIARRTVPLTGADVFRWHKNWGAPLRYVDDEGKPVLDKDGKETFGPPRPSRARHLIAMLRTLVKHAVTIAVPNAQDLNLILQTMEFPSTPARTHTVEHTQVLAFVDQAIKDGWPSVALTTLAQFEFTERRVSILGKWDKDRWIPGWHWDAIDEGHRIGITKDWVITYYQKKTIRKQRVYDFKAVPRLLALIQAIPEEQRAGAVIKCETTGEPWRKRYYAERFAEIRAHAGLPDTWWSMDMRSGGATEGDEVGVSDRELQDAGGWDDPKMKDRYRRNKQRNAQNVVALRQKARQQG